MCRTSGRFYKVVLIVAVVLGIFFYIALQGEEEKADFSQIKDQQELVQIGRKIFFGKGRCSGCHSIGSAPAAPRAPELLAAGDRLTKEFMYESLTKPEAYIKKNFDTPEPKNYPM